MKSVLYWSPFLTNVATIKAVTNSAVSLKRYSKFYKPIIINACGEFNDHKVYLESNQIEILNLINYDYHKYLPKLGYLKSRFSYFLIFIISFIPLIRLIYKKKPDIFIGHLITSLPIVISKILNNKTKFILRISGLPNLKGFRKLFWKYIATNISRITCPTVQTMDNLISQRIFDKEKIIVLKDPVISPKEVNKKSKENLQINLDKNYFNIVSIGRLTKQKNFNLIIRNFKKFLEIKKDIRLYILGDGEQKKILQNLINENNLEEKIILLGFQKNVFNYLRKCDLFILSSLWEDPGWVLIEAAAAKVLILSSDCNNGPKEFLKNEKGGLLFKNNSSESLIEKFKEIMTMNHLEKRSKIIGSKRNIRDYTIFHHFLKIEKIFDNNL